LLCRSRPPLHQFIAISSTRTAKRTRLNENQKKNAANVSHCGSR
jgi:hypothetical protein